jgi:diguanylate cyclase (GGDEF)-like protein
MNDLERKLTESRALPALPEVARRILGLLGDRIVDPAEVTSILGNEAALAADVLKLVNSPVYGLTRELGSLREAVPYLGAKAVTSSALCFSVVRTLRTGGTPSAPDQLWRCLLMNALAARRLANEVGGWEAEQALLTGLVSDCGSLLLYRLAPEYPYLIARFFEGESDLLELERANIETDHMRIGSLLLERWGFPSQLRLTVGAHHEPSNLPPGSHAELCARILTGAWLCVRALSVPGFAVETAVLDRHLSTLLGIPTAVAHAIASELPDELRETALLFEIPADAQRSHEDLLQQANQLLGELAVSLRTASMRAEDEEGDDGFDYAAILEQLQDDVTHEERTELLTRDSFDALLGAFHRRARQTHASLGLLILEIEDTKGIEERLGADGVDAVFAEIRNRFLALTRRTDQFARFGPAQIALLAPNCPPHALQNAAERLLAAVEGEAVEAGSEQVQCRAAIGLAATVPDRDGLDPRALVSLASSALDQARASSDPIQFG